MQKRGRGEGGGGGGGCKVTDWCFKQKEIVTDCLVTEKGLDLNSKRHWKFYWLLEEAGQMAVILKSVFRARLNAIRLNKLSKQLGKEWCQLLLYNILAQVELSSLYIRLKLFAAGVSVSVVYAATVVWRRRSGRGDRAEAATDVG